MAVCCVVVRQEYAGEPINCWTPSTFPQEHYSQHVNGYCWTHPLRYPESGQEAGISGVEAEEQLRTRRVVNFGTAFYRWVTLIFVLQVSWNTCSVFLQVNWNTCRFLLQVNQNTCSLVLQANLITCNFLLQVSWNSFCFLLLVNWDT